MSYDVLDARRDGLEEPLHQRELRLADHVPQRVEVRVVGALQPLDLLLVLQHRERRRHERLRARAPWRSARTSRASCRGSRPPGAPPSRSRRWMRREEVAHRVAHALGERAVLDAPRVRPALARSASRPMLSNSVVGLLREDVAQRRVAREAALEQLLLLAHAVHHVLDDVLVLAAQRAQLGELLVDAGDARVEDRRARSRRARALRTASPRRRCRAWPGMSLCDSAFSSAGRRLFAPAARRRR